MAEGPDASKSSDADGNLADKTEKVICDPCREDGNNIPVHGFCVDCNEYLCDNCYNFHLKPRPSREHVLRDSLSMPKKKAKQIVDPDIKQLAACHLHPLKEVTSICKSHDQLCCEVCISIFHCLCETVVTIEEFISEDENKTAMLALDKKLSNLETEYAGNVHLASAHMKAIDKVYQNTLNRVEAKLKSIKNKDMDKIKSVKDKSEGIHKQIKDWQSTSEKLTATKSIRQSFIFRRNIIQQLDSTKENIDQLSADNAIVRHNFIECDSSDGEGHIGKIINTPNFINTINIKHDSDEKKCDVNDIALLPDGKVIITDGENNSIKLVDLETNEILSQCKFSSSPWSTAVAESGEVFVTQSEESVILKLTSPGTDVTQFENIRIEDRGKYDAARLYNGNLFAVSIDLCAVKELDTTGHVLRTLVEDLTSDTLYDDKQPVQAPCYADVCSKTGSLLVTCWKSNTIVEVTQEGTVQVLVQSDQLESPHGILVNSDDSMLVCSFEENILHVTRAGDICPIFQEDALPFIPRAVAFEQSSQKLYIVGLSNVLLIYQL